MSTRVHELAKELGMKSQELLDRIQKSGLDVKPSPLASLDPATVTRIRDLVQGAPGSAPAPRAATAPPPPAPVRPPSDAAAVGRAAPVPSPTPRPPEATATPVPSAPAPPKAPTPSPAPPARAEAAPASTPAPAAPAPTPTSPPMATTRPVAPAAPPAPAAGQSLAAGSPPVAPRSAPGRPEGPAGPRPGAPGPVGPRATGPGPLAAHSRGGAPVSRGGGGPLSGHTSHRGGPVARPVGDEGASPSGPHRQADYISPSGVRMGPRPAGAPSQQAPPVRRPLPRPGQGPDPGPRPSGPPPVGPRRPLPPVAAPTGQSGPPRRPEGPRPSEPGGKTQRPDVKLTPEQIRAMMQSGQIGGPGATAAPGRGPGPGGAGVARPMGPAALRRPAGPGMPAAPAPGVAPPVGQPSEEEDDRKGKVGPGGRPGGSADRAGRRAKRAEKATERSRVTSPVDARTLIEGDDDGKKSRGPRRSKGGRGVLIAPRKTVAEIEPPVTVRGLSEAIGVKANDLLRKLMAQGQLVTINAFLDEETAQMLALEFGVEVQYVGAPDVEDEFDELMGGGESESDEGLEPRPPVITILGHVDHGKTSLLDRIRKANVVATESGGITQHIGAYQVEHNGQRIAFVDTPGHEAFTAMRARGANVTDIVVLVVAADDGVMPQTREAIAHAKAAEVPVVVALNKIDLPNVDSVQNLNKIYGELSQEGLIPEEYGGDVPVVKTSATTGLGIDRLLETLEVVAELHELKANPAKPATGTCLEAYRSEGRGVVATVLVQDGTLRVGDAVVCGDAFGRIRALTDDKGRAVQEAPPSTPVELSGLDDVPTAGEKFAVIDDITRARDIAETRRSRSRVTAMGERQTVTLENLFGRLAEQKLKNLNLIIKADVQGSLEALTKELEKIQNDEVPIRVLLKAVGGITESDVILADASQAIIIGFRVAPEDRAITLAEEKKIDIRRYDIIYQVTDEIKKAIEGMLVPEIKESHQGRAVVLQTFKISKIGTVAGCMVSKGTIERSSKVRLIREGREIYKGDISALKRFKDDVKEVREGYECGIKIVNFDDIKVDDIIEAYRVEVIRRTL